jgi:hypothetical protein
MHKSTFHPVWLTVTIIMLLLAVIACNLPGSGSDATPTILPEGQPIPEEELPVGQPPPTPVPPEPTPEPAQDTAPASSDLADFEQQVLDALSGQRDYEGLKQFMSNPFEIMIFYGNGEQMTPDEAIEAFQAAFLPADNVFSYDMNADIAALLGEDPYEFYLGQMTGFVFTQGWGTDGTADAIMIFGQQAGDGYSWNGILLGYDGFEPPFADADLETFRTQLVNAWMPGTRDLAFVESVMAEEFWIAGTQAYLYGPMTPAEAIGQMMEDTTLSNTANVASVVYDLAAIREGINYDPLHAQGNDKHYVWVGQSGDGEDNVILVIGQADDGSYQLVSVLLVPVGYEPPTPPGS